MINSDDVVLIELEVVELVVLSSKHPATGQQTLYAPWTGRENVPHQPGVLHMDVLVRDVLVELDWDAVVVVDPLLSGNLQFKQSTHSLSGSHDGTVS